MAAEATDVDAFADVVASRAFQRGIAQAAEILNGSKDQPAGVGSSGSTPQAQPTRRQHLTETPERLLLLVKTANALDYPLAKHTHGKKGPCETAICAQLGLDTTVFPFGVPAASTVFKWLEKAVAKRRSEAGEQGKKDHTGAGDETPQDLAAAGREPVDYNDKLNQELDDFVLRENEVLREKEQGTAGKDAREKLGEDLMHEAMRGRKDPSVLPGGKKKKKTKKQRAASEGRTGPDAIDEDDPYAGYNSHGEEEVETDPDEEADEGGSNSRRKNRRSPGNKDGADPFFAMADKMGSSMESLASAKMKSALAKGVEAEAKKLEAQARLQEAENNKNFNAGFLEIMKAVANRI